MKGDTAETNLTKSNIICTDGGGKTPEGGLHYREEEPQGLLYFTRYDSVPIMVDALFDSPTSREFTPRELAERAELSPKSVSDRIGILEELGVVKMVDGTDRYTLNLDGAITWQLRELDGLIRKAQSRLDPPKHRNSERKQQENQADSDVIEQVGANQDSSPMDDVRNQLTRNNAD